MLQDLINWQTNRCRASYERLGKCFLLITQNYLKNACFINYTPDRKADMISEALMVMVKYIEDFDTTRTNPFAYFTKMAFNSFLQTIKRFKRRSEIFVPIDLAECSSEFTFYKE